MRATNLHNVKNEADTFTERRARSRFKGLFCFRMLWLKHLFKTETTQAPAFQRENGNSDIVSLCITRISLLMLPVPGRTANYKLCTCSEAPSGYQPLVLKANGSCLHLEELNGTICGSQFTIANSAQPTHHRTVRCGTIQ